MVFLFSSRNLLNISRPTIKLQLFIKHRIICELFKICTRSSDVWMLSFDNLHEMAGRATSDQFQKYKLALQLYRTFNLQVPTQDWVNVNINFRNTSRQIHFHTHKSNRLKIGMNMLSNRFFYLNGKIELDWFNLSFNSFKVKCKKLFL